MVEHPALRAFAEKVSAEFPEFQGVLDQAKAGTLSEMDALRAMSEILMSHPDLVARFQRMARELVQQMPAPQPLDHDGLVMHKPRGLPRLNPLVEAALIERAQFDEDMPELRTGSLPPGVAPAVPVDTRVRNPEALGHMLQEASQQVAAKIAAAEPERRRFIEQMAAGDATALALIEQAGTGQALTVAEAQDLAFDGKTAALDVPEYRRGQVPAPVAITPPTGSALLAMTPQERKQGAWKFLSTTQGRRSAVAIVAELVEVKLRGEGFEVAVRPFEPGAAEPVLAAHEWVVQIDGAGAVQAAFNLIDTAAIAIAKGLTKKMANRRGRVILEVTSVNTVDVRSVGWAGRLLAPESLLENSP